MNDTRIREPEVTDLETIMKQPGFQALEPVRRPEYWGVDLDPARRPGVPSHREPQMWPNARWPIEPQQGEPPVMLHGRSNRPFPPVFGTSVGFKGLAGVIRKYAYQFPDHKARYWLLKLFADRVDSWTHRAKKYAPLAIPLVGAAVFVRQRSMSRAQFGREPILQGR